MTHVEISAARDKGDTALVSFFHTQLSALAHALATDIPRLIESHADKLRLRKVEPEQIRVSVLDQGFVSNEADLTVVLYLNGESPAGIDQGVIQDRADNMIGRWLRETLGEDSTFRCSVEVTVQWVQSKRITYSPEWGPLDIL